MGSHLSGREKELTDQGDRKEEVGGGGGPSADPLLMSVQGGYFLHPSGQNDQQVI